MENLVKIIDLGWATATLPTCEHQESKPGHSGDKLETYPCAVQTSPKCRVSPEPALPNAIYKLRRSLI